MKIRFTDIKGRAMILPIVALILMIGSEKSEASLISRLWAHRDLLRLFIPWLTPRNETRCFDDLGCISIDNSLRTRFHKLTNVLPLPRNMMATRFLLYTSVNQTEGQLLALRNNSIELSTFDARKQTKFIFHGWNEVRHFNWIQKMKMELLKRDSYNVIVVDWAEGSRGLYLQAAANTRLAALETANFIKHLKTYSGVDVNDVHLIGHSLGAHVAGHVGKFLKGRIGRITGLDPAKPYFETLPGRHRLIASDAKLVDVIHTDTKSFVFGLPIASGYGITQPCGHLDFYPNNGHSQPGCIGLSQWLESAIPVIYREGFMNLRASCSHGRSVAFFTESINSNCQFLASKCSDYEKFLRGECFACVEKDRDDCAVMGYHANISPALTKLKTKDGKFSTVVESTFFLSTNHQSPFCTQMFRLTVQLRRYYARRNIEGHMNVTMHESHGKSFAMNFTRGNGLKLGRSATMSFMLPCSVNATVDYRNVRKMSVSWNSTRTGIIGRNLRIVNVAIERMELPTEKQGTSEFPVKLCPTTNENFAKIGNGETARFEANC